MKRKKNHSNQSNQKIEQFMITELEVGTYWYEGSHFYDGVNICFLMFIYILLIVLTRWKNQKKFIIIPIVFLPTTARNKTFFDFKKKLSRYF